MSINLECKKYTGQGIKEGKYITLDDAYKECPLIFKNMELERLIGKGGSGHVYLATAEYENVKFPLCVKVSIFKTETALLNSNKEVDLSYTMFINDIGPALLGANYVKVNDINGNFQYIQQHIYLEAFDSGCNKFYKSFFKRANDTEYKNMLTKTIELLDKQISIGIICADQKPENYVARKSDEVVRMIDFGGKYCIKLTNENKKHLVLGVYLIFYITTISIFIIPNIQPRIVRLFVSITNRKFAEKGIEISNLNNIVNSIIYIKNTPEIKHVLHTLDHYSRNLILAKLTDLKSTESHNVHDSKIEPFIRQIFDRLNINQK